MQINKTHETDRKSMLVFVMACGFIGNILILARGCCRNRLLISHSLLPSAVFFIRYINVLL